MTKVVHFDIAADDPERAIAFYKRVFGWQFVRISGPLTYWLIKAGDENESGIDGGLAPRDAQWQSITCFVNVPSVGDALEKLVAAGGKIVQASTQIPGVGFVAVGQDTEGNLIGMIEQSDAAGI